MLCITQNIDYNQCKSEEKDPICIRQHHEIIIAWTSIITKAARLLLIKVMFLLANVNGKKKKYLKRHKNGFMKLIRVTYGTINKKRIGTCKSENKYITE